MCACLCIWTTCARVEIIKWRHSWWTNGTSPQEQKLSNPKMVAPLEPHKWDDVLLLLQGWFGTDDLFAMLIEEYHRDDATTTPLLMSDTMGSPVAEKLQAKLVKWFQQSPIGARLLTRLRIKKPHRRGGVAHYHGLCITKKATDTVKVHIINPDVAQGR